MKYNLTIADSREHTITEYRGVELISKSKDMAKFRHDVDPEYSNYPEHPDYILFSVFPDGTVNVYEYEWTCIDSEIFEPGYNMYNAYTCQAKKCKKA